MSDRRLIEREDLPAAGLLLGSMRDDAPPPHSRARMLAALGVATAAGTVGATSGGGAMKGALFPTKWLVVSIGVVGVGALAMIARIKPTPVVERPAAIASIASIPEPPPVQPSVVALAPVIAPPASSVVASTVVTPAATSVPKKPKGIAGAIAQIDAARKALAAHDPNAALRALDRHDAEFEDSPLRPEADVLRAEALAMRGDRVAAVALARSIVERMPGTANARRAQKILDAENP